MERLIEHGFRFGGLLHIDDGHLVERYNRALRALNLPATKLGDFYIDASGYSIEVGLEMGREDYLDPLGVNRRFIVLSPEQIGLPLIRSSFSRDSQLLQDFFRANERMIRTVTLKDVIYGEIDNLVYEVSRPDDLLTLRNVFFTARTPSDLLESADELRKLIGLFNDEPDAWQDERLRAEIVTRARDCGDIRANGFLPERLSFPWPGTFWTIHIGGAYVIDGARAPVLVGSPDRLTPVSGEAPVMDMDDADGVYALLSDRGMMEPFNPAWLMSSGMLELRLRLCAAQLLLKADPNFEPSEMVGDDFLNRWVAPSAHILGDDDRFAALSRMRTLIAGDGDVEGFEASLPANLRLIFRRASPDVGGAKDVNRLIVRHLPFDLLTTYIFAREDFYRLYDALDERMKDYAVAFLSQHYAPPGNGPWRKRAKLLETPLRPALRKRDRKCSTRSSISSVPCGAGSRACSTSACPSRRKAVRKTCARRAPPGGSPGGWRF